ncbi:holo-ACP synthase [Tepidibacillus sp. HK-1]|uniref:holo-ACP synthase n=1 Tax=Tepidibacillus sp. HK-1 TaxID=1883407 RepID=UPI00085335E2|nr:holo-ACP synthase [Tepidibacillus sp. HK-1]GBF11914.1 holo-[acyl-carrier-protein] synthase [Tepidibacillus sp. HK-1]
MIIGIGIDLVEIPRIKGIIENKESHFLQKVFTQKELAGAPLNPQRKIEYLAGRFAGKEAVAKAFGTGIGKQLNWKDIEISSLDSGKPIVVIKSTEVEKENLTIHISISHTKTIAIAKVIIEQI